MIISVLTQSSYVNQKAYLYKCDFFVLKGMRVHVPLQNKVVVGMVMAIDQQAPADIELKSVVAVLDKEPIITQAQFELIEYGLSISVSEPMQWIQAILPGILKPKTSSKKMPTVSYVVPTQFSGSLTPKQQAHLSFLIQHQPITLTQANSASTSLTKALLNKKAISLLVKDKELEFAPKPPKEPFKQLTTDQQTVFDQIKIGQYNPILLFGATGSGKTEIYMHLVQQIQQAKQSALILVPEVALTPQMVQRFMARFDQDIVVYHSHMNDTQRAAAYKKVLHAPNSIVIGTRSAIFLPINNLGCIIIDEQHDTSFKQETTPTYHVIELATFIAKKNNIPLVMGSATPSLESYARALKGVYTLAPLPKRIHENFAKVTVVNMQQVYQQQQSTILSDQLKDAIQLRLDQKQQVILLLNRRGYHPSVTCSKCNQSAMCDHCDVTLTYHQADKRLHCHQCGATYQHYTCKHCQHNRFKGSGIATAKLHDTVLSLFPKARIGRLDADSTKTKDAHRQILDDFNQHNLDILIGTQMVAKGLDVPNVTLVGILQADAALNHLDYRSVETVFSLITQAAGRSGRHKKQGEVIIQAFNPQHYGIISAARQDYIGFFRQEMAYRKLGFLPPYSYLIAITVYSDQQQESLLAASQLATATKAAQINTLGPANLGRRNQRYRARIILRSTNQQEMIDQVKTILKENPFKKATVSVNVNPTHLE